MNRDFHVAAAYFRLLLRADENAGRMALQHIGINEHDLTNREYLSGEIVTKLFHLFHSMGTHSWVAEYSNHLSVGSHGSLGFAALSAPNLNAALELLTEYHVIRISSYYCELRRTNSRVAMLFHDRTNDSLTGKWLIESGLSVTKLLIEAIMGHPLGDNAQIAFNYTRPPVEVDLDKIFSTRCQFNAAHNMISIPSSWCQIPSPLSDEETYRTNLAKCRELKLALNMDSKDVVVQVTERLENHFDLLITGRQNVRSVPGLGNLADQLYMSPRTLIRKLKNQGSSYKTLLENTRREKALKMLKSTHLRVADIAERLGYNEPANFGRAFKRWYGTTPVAWRRNLSHKMDNS